MSDALYVPAIGDQTNSAWVRGLNFTGKDGKTYDLKFFTDESHFQHNIALQSCYYGLFGVGRKAKGTFRDMIKYPKDKILMTDSAGFQIASFQTRGEECKVKPIDSLRWQEANADVGFNLDFPPTLHKVAEYKHFKWSLDESIKNFQLFQDERKNYEMKLLNVLHGETVSLMEEWYSAVKDFKFDGWAIGMKPPWDPMIQAMGFMFLWEKGEFKKDSCKWVHFFGTSGKHVVPTITYAAKFLPDRIKVTYDSSSFNIGSMFRRYLMPYGIGPQLSFGETFVLNKELTTLPCDCPVCRTIGDVSRLNEKDLPASILICLHNLYQYVIYNKVLNSLIKVDTKESVQEIEGKKVIVENHFMDYLKSINISEKTLISIKFIDFAMKYSLKDAMERYHYALLPQETNRSNQKSIFSF